MITLQQYLKGTRVTKKFKGNTPAFKGCPQKRGTILRIDILKPKKPNSAKRRVVKIRLRNKRDIIAYVPGFGGEIHKLSDVLVRGGRVPDLPGVRYHIFRYKLDFYSPEEQARSSRRSKFGLRLNKKTDDADKPDK